MAAFGPLTAPPLIAPLQHNFPQRSILAAVKHLRPDTRTAAHGSPLLVIAASRHARAGVLLSTPRMKIALKRSVSIPAARHEDTEAKQTRFWECDRRVACTHAMDVFFYGIRSEPGRKNVLNIDLQHTAPIKSRQRSHRKTEVKFGERDTTTEDI